MELFQHEAGIRMVHVPYKGSGPSLSDAVGGQIPVVSSTLAAAMPHVRAGKLKALAVTSAGRWPGLPEVPSAAEVIGRPYSHLTWLGLLAPVGTPAAALERLHAESSRVLAEPAMKSHLELLGTQAVGGSSDAFRGMLDADHIASKALLKAARISAE